MADIEDLCANLAVHLIDPPTPRMAIKMINMTEILHISAISGLLQKTIRCQESLDEAYGMADEAAADLKGRILGVLEILGRAQNLKVQGAMTDVNKQTHDEIIKEMDK